MRAWRCQSERECVAHFDAVYRGCVFGRSCAVDGPRERHWTLSTSLCLLSLGSPERVHNLRLSWPAPCTESGPGWETATGVAWTQKVCAVVVMVEVPE
jgi:hypothetical protein